MAVPTTSLERHLDAKVPIVTKTDLKGKITYANPAFVDISGFELEELLGQPHNVVRHPDMPRDAFLDLWNTVRQDQPWRGLVKNRCKDGGFYWVDAYVTPLTENGQKVGYMSVRSKPSEEQKRQAEALYAAVRSGQTKFPFTSTQNGKPWLWRMLPATVLPALIAGSAVLLPGWMGGVAAGVGLLLAVVSALVLNGQVQQFGQTVFNVLGKLGEGNFRFEVPSSSISEFSRVFTGFKSMQVNLRAIIADVISGATRVKDDADNLRELAVGLMQRSEQQSDGINGVAAALEELFRFSA